MNSKVIGNAIFKVRKERSLSQTDMANDLGVSRQAVSNWERGKTYPDVETLNKIGFCMMYHLIGLWMEKYIVLRVAKDWPLVLI